MQMLVYENYNKFISATDTIRSMKANVDGMDATMQELRTRLGEVLTADRTYPQRPCRESCCDDHPALSILQYSALQICNPAALPSRQ